MNTTNSHYFTYTHLSLKVGRMSFLSLGVKGFKIRCPAWSCSWLHPASFEANQRGKSSSPRVHANKKELGRGRAGAVSHRLCPNLSRAVFSTRRLFRVGNFNIWLLRKLPATRSLEETSSLLIFVERLAKENHHKWQLSTFSLPRVINVRFPCSLSSNSTSHSMKNLAFHSLLGWKIIILPNSHCITYTFLYKRLGECTFWSWEWRGAEFYVI